jgi:hypothetical protein
MLKFKNSEYQAQTLTHYNENPDYVFFFWELRRLSPNFHTHVFVSDLYIPRIGPHISCSRIDRLIVRILKGHGNEPNFARFLHKSLWPRCLTLHFEPFRFWLRIRGDICIRKTTPRIGESGSRQECLEYPFF